MYYDVLAERVRYFKETEEGASSMCKAMEMLTDEAEKRGMERGMERGREDGKIDIVLEMLRGKLPLEMIAQMSKFSLERVKELGKMHSLL